MSSVHLYSIEKVETHNFNFYLNRIEAAVQRCPSEKVFWKYAANLRENTQAEVRFQ